MYLLGKITVSSLIPDELKELKNIAYNLWWSWNSDAIDLYREIDLALWEKLGKNPVRFLEEVNQKKIEAKLHDKSFMDKYKSIVDDYKNYINSRENAWFHKNHPEKQHHQIAYFSMEYGLNEVLPIYSGGLGVLSGDHCKAASDLGLPFVAIGLFYNQGYFSQHINHDGWQETIFADLNVSQLPLKPALDKNGTQITYSIPMPGRDLFIKLWQVHIGRIHLYLMDTDVDNNSNMDKMLTARLYGGDKETRIQQEVLLGIGGIKALDILGIKPTVYHMNEGHSSFLGLELLRKNIAEKGLDFNTAREVVSSSLVFTTHTPVPAGNDVFPLHMIDKYFNNFWEFLRISRDQFIELGLKPEDRNNFNMTVLAMKLAGYRNGVSELHGQVTRAMFNSLWTNTLEQDVPVGHITNGIHTLTWLAPSFKHMFDKYLENSWQEKLYDESVWDNVKDIPDEELWKTHNVLKTKMIKYIRDRLRDQMISNNESPEKIKNLDSLIDTDALTIGFARRFATYKRANLIFRDIERIKKILNKPDMPVQIIFAGKAHPG
jgi:starch phosphorylase